MGEAERNERSQITSIMKEQRFLTGPDKIIGDATAPPSTQTAKAVATHLASVAKTQREVSTAAAAPAAFPKKLLCDIAEAAAVAACALVPPPGSALCIAAAHAGAELCRSKTQ